MLLIGIILMRKSEDFKIALTKPLAIMLVVMWSPIFIYAWNQLHVFIIAIFYFTLSLVILLFPVFLSVNGKGIIWGGFVKINWGEIKSVSYRKSFGVPYMAVSTNKRFRWWIPLNLRGKNTFRDAVVRYSPGNNPMYDFVINRCST